MWDLPPLILHPFNERVPPSALLENSKAALMLSGLIPNDGSDREDLKRRLLAGRRPAVRRRAETGAEEGRGARRGRR